MQVNVPPNRLVSFLRNSGTRYHPRRPGSKTDKPQVHRPPNALHASKVMLMAQNEVGQARNWSDHDPPSKGGAIALNQLQSSLVASRLITVRDGESQSRKLPRVKGHAATTGRAIASRDEDRCEDPGHDADPNPDHPGHPDQDSVRCRRLRRMRAPVPPEPSWRATFQLGAVRKQEGRVVLARAAGLEVW
jgi:hypothetical protein